MEKIPDDFSGCVCVTKQFNVLCPVIGCTVIRELFPRPWMELGDVVRDRNSDRDPYGQEYQEGNVRLMPANDSCPNPDVL